MMKPLSIATIVVLLAGCMSENTPAATAVTTPENTGGPATADTGSVLVTVTDPELVPIKDVQVELNGADLRGTTDAAGQITFTGVVPGAYTVLVARPGYLAQHDKGKAIDVLAGEQTELKMVMSPVVLVDATNSYHSVFPFKGFMSCGFEGQTVLGRNTACGGWLNPGGVQISDPNHKTRFQFPLDSVQIMGIVADATWTPTTGVTGQQLRVIVTHKIECAQTCLYQDTSLNVGGRSPLHGVLLQGADNKITKKWGEDAAAYPKIGYFETGAYCTTNCTGIQLVVQQSFEKWLTTFYGAEPAADYTALPK